ncbi:MAG: molybdopterin-binding protein [Eubacteriales bacterium]|nr:molybdopterin-binding protein [Eubacteriales bacterium]
MKRMNTVDAVGQVLCHDITQIIPGVKKDAVFRKGHVITEADIPVLLSVGKDSIYIWEHNENTLHENEAADILRAVCQGANMHATAPKEGKIELIADCRGVLLVDTEKINAVNALGDMMIATRHGGFAVEPGNKLAGTRIIPLVIEKARMEQARAVAGDKPLLQVVPFQKKRFGVITTGNEVFYGRIEDAFTPVLEEKLKAFGGVMEAHTVLNDDPAKITAAINDMLDHGLAMVFCTGGMSVDPDDQTPLAIKNSRAAIVSYGAPVLPGAMFLLAYAEGGRPVMGVPGCAMYARRTILDLVLPYIMADVPITAQQLSRLGEGGLCLNCENCTFPNCGFGK